MTTTIPAADQSTLPQRAEAAAKALAAAAPESFSSGVPPTARSRPCRPTA
jgi:hypothetical protein